MQILCFNRNTENYAGLDFEIKGGFNVIACLVYSFVWTWLNWMEGNLFPPFSITSSLSIYSSCQLILLLQGRPPCLFIIIHRQINNQPTSPKPSAGAKRRLTEWRP